MEWVTYSSIRLSKWVLPQPLLFKPCNLNECMCSVSGGTECGLYASAINVVDWVQGFSEMKFKCVRYYKTVQDIEDNEFQLQ